MGAFQKDTVALSGPVIAIVMHFEEGKKSISRDYYRILLRRFAEAVRTFPSVPQSLSGKLLTPTSLLLPPVYI